MYVRTFPTWPQGWYDCLGRTRNEPEASALFSNYPKFHGNHHALEYLADGLKPIVDGRIKPDQLEPLMAKSLHKMEEEHHEPVLVMTKVADSLPALELWPCVGYHRGDDVQNRWRYCGSRSRYCDGACRHILWNFRLVLAWSALSHQLRI